jgi:hypothetical protein
LASLPPAGIIRGQSPVRPDPGRGALARAAAGGAAAAAPAA